MSPRARKRAHTHARARLAVISACAILVGLMPSAALAAGSAPSRFLTSPPTEVASSTGWATTYVPSAGAPPSPPPVGKILPLLEVRASGGAVSKQPPLVKHAKPSVRTTTVLTAPACINQPLAAGNALSIASAGAQFDPWAWGGDYRNGSSGTGDLVPSPVP